MADLMQLLQSQVTDSLMDQFAGQLGGAPKEKTSSAVSGAMSLLMGALAKNASTPEGASSLLGALDRDHDGSILDDVAGFLGGSKQASNANMLNGAGILKHLLGGKQENAASMLSKDTGMDTAQIMNLMIKVAPMVLGMLGKVKKEKNLDQNGLSDFLRTSQQTEEQSSPTGSIFTKLLDQDGDGSIIDDVAQSGFKALLGRFFGRK